MSTTEHPTRSHAICEIAYAVEAMENLRKDLEYIMADAVSPEDKVTLDHLYKWAALMITSYGLIEKNLLRVGLRSPTDRDGGPTA